ncbi:MAG: RNA polymerase sigma factor [Candidatus Hydrogenedentes bacterium]|nr:RNA polymerase sigma factor [Candidatus Hydrogenedentota bacterium]
MYSVGQIAVRAPQGWGRCDKTARAETSVESLDTNSEVRPVDGEDLRDIAAVLAGDADSYERIVRRYQGVLAAYMWRFTRNPSVCEELVHEAFVQAYFSLHTFRASAPFLHWLRKIATRVGYHHWKREARERAHRRIQAEEYAYSLPMSRGVRAESDDKGDELHRILDGLSPRDRLVLTLLYLEELDTRQIAEVTGWSHSLVRVQAFRARNRLKKLLESRERSKRDGTPGLI